METTQIEKRRAIPHKSSDFAIDIIEIWMNKNGTWEWFVMETKPNGFKFGLVYSPIVPNGEFGSVSEQELKEINATKVELSESLPPTNYSWESKDEECLHGSSSLVNPSIADLSIEENVLIEFDDVCNECNKTIGVIRHYFSFHCVAWQHTCNDECKHKE